MAVNKRTGNKYCRHAAVKYRQRNPRDVKMIILGMGGGVFHSDTRNVSLMYVKTRQEISSA